MYMAKPRFTHENSESFANFNMCCIHIYDSVGKILSDCDTSVYASSFCLYDEKAKLNISSFSLLWRFLSFFGIWKFNNCVVLPPCRQSNLSYANINIILTFFYNFCNTFAWLHILIWERPSDKSFFFVIESMAHFAMLILAIRKIVQSLFTFYSNHSRRKLIVKCDIVME